LATKGPRSRGGGSKIDFTGWSRRLTESDRAPVRARPSVASAGDPGLPVLLVLLVLLLLLLLLLLLPLPLLLLLPLPLLLVSAGSLQ
jgi:hypothetical protein